MKPKTLILIVAAVGCGLIASYMTSKLLADRNKEQPQEEEKVPVVVARQKIGNGTLIKNPEQYFVVKQFSAKDAPKKGISDLNHLKEKRLNKPLSEEQFVTDDDLIDGKTGELGVRLSPGMRAVALPANMVISGGGHVLPGSRVDLIVTVKKGEHDTWSRIVLQNMLVMAVDLITHREPDKQGHIPSVITLAATPEEAEKVKTAQAMGEISLIIRPPLDDKNHPTRGARATEVARANNSSGSTNSDTDDPSGQGSSALGKIDFPEIKPPTNAEAQGPKVEAPPPPQLFKQRFENGDTVTTVVHVIGPDGQVTTREIDRQEMMPRPERSAPGREPAKPENGSNGQPAPVKKPGM